LERTIKSAGIDRSAAFFVAFVVASFAAGSITRIQILVDFQLHIDQPGGLMLVRPYIANLLGPNLTLRVPSELKYFDHMRQRRQTILFS
jgi:hypothetical protein